LSRWLIDRVDHLLLLLLLLLVVLRRRRRHLLLLILIRHRVFRKFLQTGKSKMF
jgi:hypothetical protein